MTPSTDHNVTPPAARINDARAAAAARAREVTIARAAVAAAERAEALASEALATAKGAADDAAAAHANAASAAERAEASWTDSQTAGAWSGVERTRSLREQAAVRAKLSASTCEGAAAELHTAAMRTAAARAELSRAEESARRADDVLRGVEHNARLADDAAAAREGARLRAVDAYAHEVDAFATAYVPDLAPRVAAFVTAARALDAAAQACAEGIAARTADAARILAAGRACGALHHNETPSPLDVPHDLAPVVAAALHTAGLGGGVLAPIAPRVGASPLVRAVITAAGVEGEAPPAEDLAALVRDAGAIGNETRHGRVSVAVGEALRAQHRNEHPQASALRVAGALLALADEACAGIVWSIAPADAPVVDRALSLSRRCRDLAARLAQPAVWRW